MTQAKVADEIGLYACETDALCTKAWTSAHDFIKAHATTPIDTDTDKLIMGRAPTTDNDLTLSVSKIEDENKNISFFSTFTAENRRWVPNCASARKRVTLGRRLGRSLRLRWVNSWGILFSSPHIWTPRLLQDTFSKLMLSTEIMIGNYSDPLFKNQHFL
jgi:hypothetical protein